VREKQGRSLCALPSTIETAVGTPPAVDGSRSARRKVSWRGGEPEQPIPPPYRLRRRCRLHRVVNLDQPSQVLPFVHSSCAIGDRGAPGAKEWIKHPGGPSLSGCGQSMPPGELALSWITVGLRHTPAVGSWRKAAHAYAGAGTMSPDTPAHLRHLVFGVGWSHLIGTVFGVGRLMSGFGCPGGMSTSVFGISIFTSFPRLDTGTFE
jgi:hypothetical protein